MKPAAFEYHSAATISEAADILARLGDEGRILAGGQSLVPLMNFRLAQPEHIVDINPISELDYVQDEDGMVSIGAMTRQARVEHDPTARQRVPLLHEALKLVAHPPIRHRGTVVGSIAHADPAAELPAVALALEAKMTVTSAGGTRELAAADFFLGPFETAVQPGEFVTAVSFPVAAPGSGHAFVEFARRHGDFAIAGAGVTLTLDGGVVTDSSIVLCGVGPTPIRASAAERTLERSDPTPEVIDLAADAAVDGLAPGGDMHGSAKYRVGVARSQVRRAIVRAVERARGGE